MIRFMADTEKYPRTDCSTIIVGKNATTTGRVLVGHNEDDPGCMVQSHLVPRMQHAEGETVRFADGTAVIDQVPETCAYYWSEFRSLNGEAFADAFINEYGVSVVSNGCVDSKHPEGVTGGMGYALRRLIAERAHSAREGVLRTGALLEQYGTYEANGMAFADANEVWWLETIGGHHWMARKVPDEAYVVMPNQLGIDKFDLEKALRDQEKYRCPCEEYADLEYMCSADLKEFISKNHLDLSLDGVLNPRDAFGSHDDSDHVYNTPRAWYILRNLNPKTKIWDGVNAEFTPYSDDLPWCMIPEKKITVEDVKYVLSSHYQGTSYDPYASYGEKEQRGAFRSIGVNRTDFLSLIQMRPGMEKDCNILEWVAFASNAFNVLAPFYTDIDTTPGYLFGTTGKVSTENFYWMSRMIAAMADASYNKSVFHIERYQESIAAKSHELLNRYDTLLEQETDEETRKKIQEEANEKIAGMLQCEAADTLDKVLYELSGQMKNAYARSDA